VFRKLEKTVLAHNNNLEKLEEEMEYLDGSDYYKTQEQHEKLEEGLDDVIYEILEQFKENSKVVIVTMCSC
jgi:hypothetical protein